MKTKKTEVKCPCCQSRVEEGQAFCGICGSSVTKNIKNHQKQTRNDKRTKIVRFVAIIVFVFCVTMWAVITYFDPAVVTPEEHNALEYGMSEEEIFGIIGREHRYKHTNKYGMHGKFTAEYIYEYGDNGFDNDGYIKLVFVGGVLVDIDKLSEKEYRGMIGQDDENNGRIIIEF